MSMDKRPPVGTPEFEKWVRERIKDDVEKIFSGPRPDFDERGPLGGSGELLDKTDAELFPDELEEYTPEERRKLLKLYKNEKNDDKKS